MWAAQRPRERDGMSDERGMSMDASSPAKIFGSKKFSYLWIQKVFVSLASKGFRIFGIQKVFVSFRFHQLMDHRP